MKAFRTTRPSPGPGDADRPSFQSTATAPFSHAQILHLMKAEFARGRRYGFAVSCILIEPDRMGGLVERHGSALRDAVREQMTAMVTEKTRGADQLGLISEDRLLLLLPHTDESAATIVAERLLDIAKTLEIRVDGNPVNVTFSLAVATCADQDTLFFDTMLSQAEVALEWAAEAGGDQVCAFRRERFVDRS